MNKEEIVKELRNIKKKYGISPTKRDIPTRLYYHCIKEFNYFNKAKEAAKLNLYNKRDESLPESSYLLDKDLVKLVSFLTFDGHLYKSLNAFLLISKNKEILKKYEKLIKNKFGLSGSYRIKRGFGEAFNYRIFNKRLSTFLNLVGTPKGDKMLVSFDIPDWIKKNKEFSREYLRIAYFCEGCKYQHSKNRESIQFNLNKSEELLKDGLNFTNSLKSLLKTFNIETTETWVIKGNKRKKDGKITKTIRFKIKANSINKFIKEIGWYK